MLKRKKHKKSECWLFCVERDLNIGRKLLDIEGLKLLSGKERQGRPQPWGQLCPFGPKGVQSWAWLMLRPN